MTFGTRATWYPEYLRVRGELERRGEYIAASNLLKTIYRCTSKDQVDANIRLIAKRYGIDGAAEGKTSQ